MNMILSICIPRTDQNCNLFHGSIANVSSDRSRWNSPNCFYLRKCVATERKESKSLVPSGFWIGFLRGSHKRSFEIKLFLLRHLQQLFFLKNLNVKLCWCKGNLSLYRNMQIFLYVSSVLFYYNEFFISWISLFHEATFREMLLLSDEYSITPFWRPWAKFWDFLSFMRCFSFF